MFLLSADKSKLTANKTELLASGTVNVHEVQIAFDDDWDGLEKVVVFRAGNREVSTFLDETNQCMIPWEVLKTPKLKLDIGVYGQKDGTVILPTIWVNVGTIQQGVEPSEMAQVPSPSLWSQMVDKLAQEVAPTIGENGNWYIGGEDTGVPASGGGGGTGNVFSLDVDNIVAVDQGEYDAIPQPRPAKTLYLIRG